jgi:adenylate cyclase
MDYVASEGGAYGQAGSYGGSTGIILLAQLSRQGKQGKRSNRQALELWVRELLLPIVAARVEVAPWPRASKLAAILAADVVGYSRLVGADEAATIARLKAVRKELIEPLIAEYRGRMVKLVGDGALVEFASAVDAVECAVAIQHGVAEREAGEPEDRRIQFRIGINVGDFIVEDGDILGDGVNVAARLEGLAEPGGICVARNVHNQIKAKLALPFEAMGQHRMKNIAEPIEVWRVALDDAAPKPRKRHRIAPLALAAGIAALLALGSAGAWWWHQSRAAVQNAATDLILEMPAGPSIAVLPFTNLTGDPAQEYFVDGVTEDIITELSKFQPFRVITRNSTFRYKGQAVDVREVGKDLGARYAVEGSVRRSSERIRVSVQLLDATDGDHVWGQTYDRDLTAQDVFAIQDEITLCIANTVADAHGIVSRELTKETRRKSVEELSSYECVLRLHEYNRVNTVETHLAALQCLEHTVKSTRAIPTPGQRSLRSTMIAMPWGSIPSRMRSIEGLTLQSEGARPDEPAGTIRPRLYAVHPARHG